MSCQPPSLAAGDVLHPTAAAAAPAGAVAGGPTIARPRCRSRARRPCAADAWARVRHCKAARVGPDRAAPISTLHNWPPQVLLQLQCSRRGGKKTVASARSWPCTPSSTWTMEGWGGSVSGRRGQSSTMCSALPAACCASWAHVPPGLAQTPLASAFCTAWLASRRESAMPMAVLNITPASLILRPPLVVRASTSSPTWQARACGSVRVTTSGCVVFRSQCRSTSLAWQLRAHGEAGVRASLMQQRARPGRLGVRRVCSHRRRV